MSRLSEARASLHAALSHVLDEPIQLEEDRLVAFSPGRVHAYPPGTIAAPCVFIEQPSGQVGTTGAGNVLFDLARFPVAVIYDGTDRAQVAGLDELVARVWDASRAAGEPVAFTPGPLDTGGPNLRATYVDVEVRIRALTLCGSAAPAPVEVVAHG